MRYTTKDSKPNKPHFCVWIMQIAATLGCLTLISIYLLSGVYAKFSSSASGSDSARVAKFDVQIENLSATQVFNELGTTADAEQYDYKFKVVNNSEVAINYSLKVTFNNAPPANVTLWIDDKEAVTCGETKTEFILLDDGTLNYKDNKEHTLSIKVKYINGDKLIDFDSFTDKATISVIVEQKD